MLFASLQPFLVDVELLLWLLQTKVAVMARPCWGHQVHRMRQSCLFHAPKNSIVTPQTPKEYTPE